MWFRATQAEELVRLRQAALRRARGSARLSRPLYPPRRHLEQPPRRPRRARRAFPLQGLSPQRPGAVSHDDAGTPRVHQALSPPRLATCKANIARAKELIAAPLPSIYPSTEHDDADVAAGAAADHRPPCPCCGGRMIIV